MKKIFMTITLCIMCTVCFTSCNTVTVKDGKNNDVSLSITNYTALHRLPLLYKNEIRESVDNLRQECKYPASFVPTKATIDIVNGQYAQNIKITIYGYAKNGFGVECEVEETYLYKKK